MASVLAVAAFAVACGETLAANESDGVPEGGVALDGTTAPDGGALTDVTTEARVTPCADASAFDLCDDFDDVAHTEATWTERVIVDKASIGTVSSATAPSQPLAMRFATGIGATTIPTGVLAKRLDVWNRGPNGEQRAVHIELSVFVDEAPAFGLNSVVRLAIGDRYAPNIDRVDVFLAPQGSKCEASVGVMYYDDVGNGAGTFGNESIPFQFKTWIRLALDVSAHAPGESPLITLRSVGADAGASSIADAGSGNANAIARFEALVGLASQQAAPGWTVLIDDVTITYER